MHSNKMAFALVLGMIMTNVMDHALHLRIRKKEAKTMLLQEVTTILKVLLGAVEDVAEDEAEPEGSIAAKRTREAHPRSA